MSLFPLEPVHGRHPGTAATCLCPRQAGQNHAFRRWGIKAGDGLDRKLVLV